MAAPIRVLVAEDDYFVAQEIVDVVVKSGLEPVGIASDGVDAVDQTRQLRPDVVLMDLRMPNLDGIRACQLIQEACPTPVVIVTAFESEALTEQATTAGACAYLVKPPRPGDLKRAVTIAMARHREKMVLRDHNRELADKKQDLEEALEEISALENDLPLCTTCSRVEAPDGTWRVVANYIRVRGEVAFSHTICPTCETHYRSTPQP